MKATGETIDPAEVARFSAQAPSWWDPAGSFAPLHRLNPVRLQFIRDALITHFDRDPRSLTPFAGLTLCDIGCGGGLIAEPMARLGFAVTALDADAEAIAVAREHAAEALSDKIDGTVGRQFQKMPLEARQQTRCRADVEEHACRLRAITQGIEERAQMCGRRPIAGEEAGNDENGAAVAAWKSVERAGFGREERERERLRLAGEARKP